MTRYSLERIEVHSPRVRQSTWSFAGKPARGDEYTYAVKDLNHRSRNQWEFIVRIPDARDGRIEVRPIRVPNDIAYASLERRSITFARATHRRYSGKRYLELSLADPTGVRTRRLVRLIDKNSLPYWFRPLASQFRKKTTVRETRGNDGDCLVIVVDPTDHVSMIKLFLASKAWVLKAGFVFGVR